MTEQDRKDVVDAVVFILIGIALYIALNYSLLLAGIVFLISMLLLPFMNGMTTIEEE